MIKIALNKPLAEFYPGWMVHAGLFICALVAVGCSTYTFGLFVVPVSEEFGASRADINTGFIAFLIGVGVISPIVGRMLDRFSARLVILAGGLALVLGMAGIFYTDSLLLMLPLILGPLAFGYAACGTLGANTVIVRWFERRRGMALGILAVSTSTGGFLFGPFTALMIEHFGWRPALLINGAVAGTVIVLIAVFILRNSPAGSEYGYRREFEITDEDGPIGDKEEPGEERVWTLVEVLRNSRFWFLTLGIGMLYASDQAMVTSQVPYFLDIGIELPAAAIILSCMTASAIGGKLVVGYFADKVDLRYLFYGVALAHMGLLVLYLLQPGYWVLLFFATLFGVAIGGVFPVWATLLAWLFGSKSYGTVMGAMTLVLKLLSIIAVRFIGEVYDATASYQLAFTVFIGMIVLGILLISRLRPHAVDSQNTGTAQ